MKHLLLVVVLTGCVADEGTDAPYQPLIETGWSLAPTSEAHLCVRQTVSTDLYISGFEANAPTGTHHTVLTTGDPDRPDGVEECSTFTNHQAMLYGSGVGSNRFEFPDGVGVYVAAGQQLLLNLHVFNTSDVELAGVSGIRFQAAEPDARIEEAEAVLMGPLAFRIPPGAHTITGGCSITNDATLFAVAPHMHQLGTHAAITARRTTGDVVLHDADYSFDAQLIHPIDPVVPVTLGDVVEIGCTYFNPTSETVEWGESSEDEMCFAGLYRYPRQRGGGVVCAF